MRGLGAGVVAIALAAGGCTSVKVVQRDGCWVRQTERKLGGLQEEVGPCRRPEPKWVEDRLTRLVQECIAQADYRWQGRALAAWNRREPLPPEPRREALLKDCMDEAAAGIVSENETLKKRLVEIAGDRDALRALSDKDREELRASAEQLAEYLGEAAKKPAGTAFATAPSKSDGTAQTENGSRSETTSGPQQPSPAPVVPADAARPAASPAPAAGSPQPSAAPAPKQKRARRPLARRDPPAKCDPGTETAGNGNKAAAPVRCDPARP